ncbi:YqgE/AlgH family protein [Dactylosporangium sp. CA-152071]|uniref:YqgE/AlgH family protein n=1 Tax=Dactylosporangium sp. CA-152071 TaxID=3239933 RepID=UPI003D91C7C4
MTQLSDARRSRVVLVGSSTYDNFPAIPAVTNNLTALRDVLVDPHRWGLDPDACRVVHNPETTRDVHAVMRRAAAEVDVSGLLLLYFAGHGVIDPDTGVLHLAVGQTMPDSAYSSAVPFDWVRRLVQGSRSAHRVVILDCCYAGRAIPGLGADDDAALATQVEIDRSCVLVAASGNRIALAPPDEPLTAFTGALVELLRDGVAGGPPLLDLGTLHDEIRRVQRARGRPIPELRARNGGDRIPIVHNAATQRLPAVPPEPPTPETPRLDSSLVGRVLRGAPGAPGVADPELAGDVAILAHSPIEGAIGVRLDRPATRSPAHVLGEELAGSLHVHAVLDGGPVRDVILLLGLLRPGYTAPDGWRVLGRELVVVPLDAYPALAEAVVSAAYLFVGYLGWRPQQLETELAAGHLVDTDTDLATWLADPQHAR